MTDREWIAEDDHLNREALHALMNFRVDRERALAELFNSEVPIHWFVRKALAAALSGRPVTFGSSLEFKGSNDTREKAMAYAKRLEWLAIADWVNERKLAENGKKKIGYDKACAEAGVKFNCSVQKVKLSVTYANAVDNWVASAQIPGTEYGNWRKEDLRHRYIGFDASGEPMPPNRTLQELAAAEEEQRAVLRQLFPDDSPDS